MLQGAIIGLIVGLVMVVVRMVKAKRGGTKVVSALQRGGPEGLAALDGYVKPVHGKVSATRLLDLLERYSWLAVMGAHDALESEAAQLHGHINVVSQLQAQAAVGLLAHRTEARDLARLREVADHIEAEGGALSKLVKKQLRDLELVSRALESRQLDVEAHQRVLARARQTGPATKLVLYRFVTRAVEQAGGDATHLRHQADQVLSTLG